jgi:hypothetical protein
MDERTDKWIEKYRTEMYGQTRQTDKAKKYGETDRTN